jgi:hypothetical protein
VKNFKTEILKPGQLVKAVSDLYCAEPKGSLLVSEGTIGTVMAHGAEEEAFRPAWKVCFGGVHEWYVSKNEVQLVVSETNEDI